MSYGRASSDDKLDPAVIQALAKITGLDVSMPEAEVLTALLLNQMAAIQSLDAFDLRDTVPAPVFRLEGASHD